MQALDQIKLADEVGFDIVWAVEHHFLTEYAHSSAPEIFLEVLGMDQFITFQQMGRVPHERIMESIQLYGDEAIPHFKAKAAQTEEQAASGG